MSERANPDQLLKHVQAEEELLGRGRLKLFFGAGPGVGKTYAMLEAARQKKREGWDVVVGLVETHGRAETEALLQGLEVLPRRELIYKNVALKEFDLDSALKRHPRLIIVDELAHTNAAGSRHSKRWQDIEELLDAGIDVYTALNVQHWESLNDVVKQITGVVVRETVPDTFLARAYELELVDLAPDDLLQRLKDGKIYQGEVAGRAAENFFQPGNLIALRELALRHTAERVDAQMQAFKERHSIDELWHVGEKLLVGVSSSPVSIRMIRAAHRLASRLHAPWIAVHVEIPTFRMSEQERARAIENLKLAESLGAETLTLMGDNVAAELLSLARAKNITRIILGKPDQPKWKEIFFGSILNNIARDCGDIDLHVIGRGDEPQSSTPVVASEENHWRGVGQAVTVVALCTVLCWPLFEKLDRANLVMIYLLGVVWTAYRFGRRVSTLASILSVLFFDFFFVPPYLTFAVTDTQYLVMFAIMLGVGLLISSMAGKLRQQTEFLRARADRLRALYRLSRSLSETPDVRRMLGGALSQLDEFYRRPVLILTSNARGEIEIGAGNSESFGWTENEKFVAQWVHDHEKPAGRGSETLAGAKGFYVPLKGIRANLGALGIIPKDSAWFKDPEQLGLFETFASEIGGAIESTKMTDSIARAELEVEQRALNSSDQHSSELALTRFLNEKRIVFFADDESHENILRELLSRIAVPNKAKALQAVIEREKAGETVIGEFLHIPHARVAGINQVEMSLGISKKTQKIWLLFVSPIDDPRLHLSVLAQISKTFHDPGRAHALLAQASPSAVVSLFNALP